MLPGKQPREHQLRAMSAAHAYFQDHDRGKLIMACGTGKTYTALKIAEDLLNNKRSEEHTSELQSHHDLVCRLLHEK